MLWIFTICNLNISDNCRFFGYLCFFEIILLFLIISAIMESLYVTPFFNSVQQEEMYHGF